MTRAALQAKVGLEKQASPEKFCPAKGCLWRTQNGELCPRHAPGWKALLCQCDICNPEGKPQ